MEKLPVLVTVWRAYSFLFHEIGTIFRLSWVALLVIQAMDTFVELKFGSSNGGGLLVRFAVAYAGLAGASIVAVAIHRIILFEDRHPGLYLYIDFRKVEWLFVLTPILIGLSIAIVVGLLVVLPPVKAVISAITSFSDEDAAIYIMVLPLMYFVFRLSIVFPVIVVERRIDLKKAWRLTRGNSWRFLAVLLLADGVIYLTDGAFETLMAIPKKSASPDFSFLMAVGVSIYHIFSRMVSIALGVAALSYSYKFLSGHEPDDVLTPQV